MDEILDFLKKHEDIVSLLFSGFMIPILLWVAKKLRDIISKKNGKSKRKSISAYYYYTDKLIADKLWRFDPYKNHDMKKRWVPLSASVSESERIPPVFIKKVGNLPTGKTISNLNKFIKKNQDYRIPFALTGAPGSGKTFELVKLYDDYREAFRSTKNWIPILIFINEIQPDVFKQLTGKHALKEFVISYLKKTGYDEKIVHFFEKNFYKLKLLFLFDALDEIPEKDDYNFALMRIKEFIKDVELNKWCFFLSCRTEDFDSRLDLVILEIQPLTSKQIDMFFKKKRVPNSQQEKLRILAWKKLKGSEMPWFQPYIANPYFLSIMLDSIEYSILENTDTPVNMRELFRSALKKELFKANNPAMSVSFYHTFEIFCSIVAFFLLEKSSGKTNSRFDIVSEDDLLNYFKTCNLLSKKGIEPFFSIFNLIEHVFSGPNRDWILYSKASANLGKFLEYGAIGNLTIETIDEINRNFDTSNCAHILKRNIENLKLYSNLDIDVLVRKVVSVIKSISNKESEFAFLCVTFVAYSLIINVGLERRLLRVDPINNSAITGYRHRRLLEYFGANFIDLTKVNFSAKVEKLWYKQTLCILSAITTDLEWFFCELDTNESDNLFTIADIIQFVHPQFSEKKPKYFDAVISKLHFIIAKSESLSKSYKSLRAIYNIVLAGHWEPPKVFAERLIALANEIPLFNLCLNILALLDGKNRMDRKIRFRFIKKCIRNVLSARIVKKCF